MLLPLPPIEITGEITAASILAEGTVGNLAAPKTFRAGQNSSYDRRSVAPGTEDWFANRDWGHHLREETNEGRREWVMADLKGPGAVVRQWTPDTSTGVWRYYFDGEKSPRLTTTGKEIAAGRWLGFGEPHAYVASRGGNLYYPLPYARSLKVTVDASDGDPARMYYVLGRRSYPAGTPVASFDRRQIPLQTALPFIDSGSDPSDNALSPERRERRYTATGRVPADDLVWLYNTEGTADRDGLRDGGPETIVRFELRVKLPPLPPNAPHGHPAQPHNVLRNLVLDGRFDRERCLSVPVPDFFGAPPQGSPYATDVCEVRADGTFVSRLPMPFRRSAALALRNLNPFPVEIESRLIPVAGVDPGALLLHAQYRRHPGPSRPSRDLPVAHLRGRGHYAGTVLHVANPSVAWWGEGDERVRVDGEAFPSIFGTGTEDYFGYAWSSNLPFSRPYHAQPSAGQRGNSGQIANVRWHVLDPIPYTKALDFDLELWHWADTKSHFATTAFWYAAPGGTPATPLRRSDLAVPEIVTPKPEPGAIQGEALTPETTGGTTEVQSGFEELADAQLWWRDPAVGDRLTLRLPDVEPGRYIIQMRACYAKDYGQHKITLDGANLGTHDFYEPELGWRTLSLGMIGLKGESPKLEIRAVGSNPKADPRRMFGLDWIKLVRVR